MVEFHNDPFIDGILRLCHKLQAYEKGFYWKNKKTPFASRGSDRISAGLIDACFFELAVVDGGVKAVLL
jgi:hypothetical protein